MIILQGLPASGKSTVRKALLAENTNMRYVNKDELRAENPELSEYQIHLRHQADLEELLKAGFDVVVDNTNFHTRTVNECKALAAKYGAEVELQVLDTSWQECIRRDERRRQAGERYVGRSVIIGFAMRYGFYKEPKQKAVIFDIDGTLALIEHRRHFVQPPEGQKKDWKAFFAALSLDTVNQPVKQLYDLAKEQYTIILCSGRPEDHRIVTELWLEKYDIAKYVALFMRAKGDKRQDYDVKKELYERYIKPYFEVQFAVDDRNAVVKMWREQGITCFQCAEGDF